MEHRSNLIFLDIETGGFKVSSPIIELAAVAVESGSYKELGTMEMKIEFEMKDADPKALGVSKFTPTAWERYAIPEKDAAAKFSHFLERHATNEFPSKKNKGETYSLAKVAAYNSDFDVTRLEAWAKRTDTYFPMMRMSLCVMQRTLWFFEENQGLLPPENYKLGTVAEHLGLRNTPDHSALADTRATVELAKALAEYNRISTTRAA